MTKADALWHECGIVLNSYYKNNIKYREGTYNDRNTSICFMGTDE